MKSALMIHAAVVACLLSTGSVASVAQEADAKLNAFFKQYLDESFRLRPMEATGLGDHRFDHLLDDLSAKARAGWVEHDRKTLEELPRQIEFEKLSRPAKLDYQIFQHELTKSLWLAENTHRFEQDPRVYSGYISDSVFLLLIQSTLPKETNVANAIARMKQIPKVVAAARENLKNPPQVHTETAIRQNRGAIGFYEGELFELARPTPQTDALKAAAKPVVACLKEYQAFLEKDLLPRAGGDWRLGKEKFARKLELEFDAGLSAPQVLAMAESEFACGTGHVRHRPAALEPLLPQEAAAAGR